ncbi:hypothetical protein DOM21_14010 [Bacteriovorax stolpii]|nr:hypothetical protein DOM21_14010 [Bacteriovorax stolpii]
MVALFFSYPHGNVNNSLNKSGLRGILLGILATTLFCINAITVISGDNKFGTGDALLIVEAKKAFVFS